MPELIRAGAEAGTEAGNGAEVRAAAGMTGGRPAGTMKPGKKGDRGGRGFGPGNCRNLRESFGEVEDAEAAAAIVGELLEQRQNPYLQVGKVTETGRDFEVEIVTKDGSLANKLFVEKRTGRIIPAYR
jgi:hypothetical protein